MPELNLQLLTKATGRPKSSLIHQTSDSTTHDGGRVGGRKWKFFSPVWTAMLQHLAFTKVSGDGR